MRIAITDGRLVTGDGKTVLEKASVIIQDQTIKDVSKKVDQASIKSADVVIDAREKVVIPGLINQHSHGITFGSVGCIDRTGVYAKNKALGFLYKHMLEGETTILSVDGLTDVKVVERTAKFTPINLKAATSRTPSTIRGLQLYPDWDSSYFDHYNVPADAEEQVKKGAVAFGEIAYYEDAHVCIGVPDTIKAKTGMRINVLQSYALRKAILGTGYDPSAFDRKKAEALIKQFGLPNITVDEIKKIVEEHLPEEVARCAFKGAEEAAVLCKKFDVPMILHCTPTSLETVLKIARELKKKVIAAHCNWSVEADEAVSQAKKVKEAGALIDITSGDAFDIAHLMPSPEPTYALLREGLVDVISTDFMQGHHDAMLLVLQEAMKQGIMKLPEAIALATGNVAKACPKLAPNRGYIAPGKVADLAIVDEDRISSVDTVIVGGKIAVGPLGSGRGRFSLPTKG